MLIRGYKGIYNAKKGRGRRRNPLALDPSRTNPMRKAFEKVIKSQFARLKLAIVKKVVEEDCFGLLDKQIQANSLVCKSNQIKDVTAGDCGPGISLGIDRKDMPQIRKEDFYEFKKYLIDKGLSLKESSIVVSKLKPSQKEYRQERVDDIPLEKAKKLPILISSDNYVLDGTHRWIKLYQDSKDNIANVLRIPLKARAALDLLKRFPKAEFVANIVSNKEEFKFKTSPEQLAAFQEWLLTQTNKYITGTSQEELWNAYIKQGYSKGAGRSFEDVATKKWPNEPLTAAETRKKQFLQTSFAQPETKEKVQLLASRSFDDLENIDSDMSTKISRVLVDGLIEGSSPTEIAHDMIEQVDIQIDRACLIARTEIIRAHSEGQLDAMEAMGVEDVGVSVEWSTSGITCRELTPKQRKITTCVCDLCAPLEGVVLKVSEARGMLPRHPGCRCAFIPSGVGEDDTDQIDTAEGIREALRQSAEAGYDGEWDKQFDIDDDRPKSLLTDNSSYAEDAILLLNEFCPTGIGGGIDPTCGKGGLPKEKMPEKPTFFASAIPAKAHIVKDNEAAVKEMQELASKGDVAGLIAHPGTPSVKVQQYKTELLGALGDHHKALSLKESPKPVEPTTTHLPNPANLTLIKTLPGSTSPKLMQDPQGDKWVVKDNPNNPGHLRNEAEADAIYRAAGVLVPPSGIVETNNGPAKIAKFLEGAESLGSWLQNKSEAEKLGMYEKIGKHAVLDSLLGNWDVVGMNKDNILIKEGEPYRVDNGGALKYRAQGELKNKAAWESSTGEVKELKTMLDPKTNPQTAEVYAHLSPSAIHNQILSVIDKKKELLAAVKDPENKAVLEKRLEHLESLLHKAPEIQLPKPPVFVPPKTTETKPEPKPSAPVSSPSKGKTLDVHTGEGLANILKMANLGITDLHLAKIAYANPNGLTGDKIKIVPSANYTAATKAKHEALQNKIAEYLKPFAPSAVFSLPKASINAKSKGIAPKPSSSEFKLPVLPQPSQQLPQEKAKEQPHQTPTESQPSQPPQKEQDVSVKDLSPKLSKYLPDIKSNSSMELPNGNFYDEQEHLKWKGKLTKEQVNSIAEWKSSASFIKDSIAAVGKDYHLLTGIPKEFLDAIRKSPAHEGVVYRGLNGKYAKELAKTLEENGIGSTWTENTPHCMSVNSKTGVDFAGGALLLRIITKTGRPIHKVAGFDSEAEVTGMPHTTYKVVSIAKNVEVKGKFPKTIKHVITLMEI